uniref:Uncharacterized protein n=1 Tax=Rhizophora mucronata TaxID=61149 RepID=A0A2P2P8Q8_RHIMU
MLASFFPFWTFCLLFFVFLW